MGYRKPSSGGFLFKKRMGKTILIFLLAICGKAHGLNIREVRVAAVSANAINVAVDTEAAELYYFHSGNYMATGNRLVIEAYYVEGFGATIEYLNNNFEIPADTRTASDFILTVRIFYIDLRHPESGKRLQDEMTATFSVPISGNLLLYRAMAGIEEMVLFPNPVKDLLSFSAPTESIRIYDLAGRRIRTFGNREQCIDLSDFRPGMYMVVVFHNKQQYRRMIIKL